MPLHRRQLLKALGLGALATVTHGATRTVRADAAPPPKRIVLFVTPHGLVPKSWMMTIPDAPTDRFAERPLVDLRADDFSEVLRPLHPFRDRLLPIEGLSHTSVLADIAELERTGTGDRNNHSVAVAHLLTGVPALQRAGVPCSGGARSLDQELAVRTAAPGRFGSRVYGFDYTPNATVAPFSFLGPGQAAPIVADPRTAFADLLGYVPVATGTPDSRDAALAALRPSVLDSVAREYELLAPRLDAEGQRKLQAHRDLVRQLEASLGASGAATCNPTFDGGGHVVTQFMRLIKLGISCDLTRVFTFVAPVPQCPEIGYPADTTIHAYAHQSIAGATSCGTTFNPVAEHAITDLGVWYAGHFATLLQELDSVIEGDGTALDHTLVVWMSELATPTHLHHDTFTLVAGAGDFFQLGRYVRFPRSLANPLAGYPRTGPASNRFYVSLLQAMGQTDDRFGMTRATGADGSTLDLTGPLSELHRS